ncbi:uncharacterized protein TNCV_2045961 [Trichonephila clavipes]|uniref:DUF5641 domain-containing protein n=1 Tax=Trichonephila clavipes TaxID=2585209 RepID=A0A8X6SUT8_TRICX|nr:uncharacterized protein TNCV_2045961 [Trichonephila clavipes]
MDKKVPFSSQALCEKSSQCNSTSNRSELLETRPIAKNPADIISRGIDPDKIQDCVLWWYGPSVLKNNPAVSHCDISEINDNDLYVCELKKSDPVCLITQNVELLPIINKCSSFVKLKRILAWCLRFKENARNPYSQRTIGNLTATELSRALICLIRNVQSVHFPLEIQCLLKGKQIPNSSSVLNFFPFLDENSILHVGGRLKHSNLTVNQKHPMLILNKGPISNLLINYYHVLHFHTGVESTTANIRSEFWIINCRNQVRKVLKNCISCLKVNAKATNQVMADLPSDRVTASRVFTKIGIDYAGPFFIKLYPGANNELKNILQNLFIKEGKKKIENLIASEGIVWHFNPLATPPFGGLWEEGIKSLKYHLKRVIGNTILAYEEFVTLETQMEAVLNSRPLNKISSDPNDSILTPGHFLVGTSLTALPEPDLTNTLINRLNRWQLVQTLTQTFWKKWSNDYRNNQESNDKGLDLLVHRGTRRNDALDVGDVVLTEHDNVRRIDWPLGVALEVCSGKDGVPRVARIRTSHGERIRPFQRLYPLEVSAKTEIGVLKASGKDSLPVEKNSESSTGHVLDSPTDYVPDSPVESTDNSEEKPPTKTRLGRTIKIPRKLDL